MALIVRPMRYVSLSRFACFSLSAERDDKRTQTLPCLNYFSCFRLVDQRIKLNNWNVICLHVAECFKVRVIRLFYENVD